MEPLRERICVQPISTRSPRVPSCVLSDVVPITCASQVCRRRVVGPFGFECDRRPAVFLRVAWLRLAFHVLPSLMLSRMAASAIRCFIFEGDSSSRSVRGLGGSGIGLAFRTPSQRSVSARGGGFAL